MDARQRARAEGEVELLTPPDHVWACVRHYVYVGFYFYEGFHFTFQILSEFSDHLDIGSLWISCN